MFERFEPDARAIVLDAATQARRLGHRYVGCEHVLLALAASNQPVGSVLREHGVTSSRVEAQIVRQVGIGAGAGIFADLDREALAAVGIDLDAVRARVEARFGADALSRAATASRCRRRRPRRTLRRLRPGRLARRWRGRLTDSRQQPPRSTSGQTSGGHLPFTARAKQTMANAIREAQAQHDGHIGIEHVALGLMDTNQGLVPPILSALGTSPAAVHTAISERYRRAS